MLLAYFVASLSFRLRSIAAPTPRGECWIRTSLRKSERKPMGSDATLDVLPPSNGRRRKSRREFVNATEFCSLAISNRTLVRSDDRDNCLRGLHDPESGITYVIHEDSLFGERNLRAAESRL